MKVSSHFDCFRLSSDDLIWWLLSSVADHRTAVSVVFTAGEQQCWVWRETTRFVKTSPTSLDLNRFDALCCCCQSGNWYHSAISTRTAIKFDLLAHMGNGVSTGLVILPNPTGRDPAFSEPHLCPHHLT